MLVLIGGAALASPFLRPPRIEMDANISESPLTRNTRPSPQLATVGFSRDAVPDANGSVASASASETDRSGAYASPKLPAWATQPSRLDDLISQGAAPPWDDEPSTSHLQPLQPWMDRQLNQRGLPSTQPDLRSLAGQPSALGASPFDERVDGYAPAVPQASVSAQSDGGGWPAYAPTPPPSQSYAGPAMTSTSHTRQAAANDLARLSSGQGSGDRSAGGQTQRPPAERRFVYQPGMQQP
jgi:hypothetical protein